MAGKVDRSQNPYVPFTCCFVTVCFQEGPVVIPLTAGLLTCLQGYQSRGCRERLFLCPAPDERERAMRGGDLQKRWQGWKRSWAFHTRLFRSPTDGEFACPSPHSYIDIHAVRREGSLLSINIYRIEQERQVPLLQTCFQDSKAYASFV